METNKKAWSSPALVLISNGNIESKSKTSVHEATGHYITVPGHFKAFVNPSSVGFDVTVHGAPFYSKDAAIS
ncbi:hypothetical protein BEL04_09805 [Mucilaginibacter sp. PPCGB 2223]|uniref:hypothetical protein n=1 Tax=Mucilaginibacter sp. PPCGB 2223 TaxID=1886027 RepID=UPI0008240815|nr:hypothetical protein [Mucilaginibacter sp. PPCGB 2223]OCX54520.1 hypothetical protein BEL04_09805 [Mucilaginibacter sp. PPCGB 2223]